MWQDATKLPLGMVVKIINSKGVDLFVREIKGKIGVVRMSVPCPTIRCIKFEEEIRGSTEWCLHNADIEILNDPDGNYL